MEQRPVWVGWLARTYRIRPEGPRSTPTHPPSIQIGELAGLIPREAPAAPGRAGGRRPAWRAAWRAVEAGRGGVGQRQGEGEGG